MKTKSIIFLILTVFILCNCAFPKKMQESNFNLQLNYESSPPLITLIKNLAEFNSYLSNKDIFLEEFTEEFLKTNSKYDSNFFNRKYLIAIIIQATSGMITGYSLEGLKINNNDLIVGIKAIAPSKYVTHDMGRYFTYYIEVNKNSNINGVLLKVS